MGARNFHGKGTKPPKRGEPGIAAGRLTAYENVVQLFELFHRVYGWTVAEMDATELDYLFTLMRVKELSAPEPDSKIHYIDEVL